MKTDIVNNLIDSMREKINDKNLSFVEAQDTIDYIYREIYYDNTSMNKINGDNFFYVVTLDKFFVQKQKDNPYLINYLHNFLNATISVSMQIFSNTYDSLLTFNPINPSLSQSNKAEIYETIGDLCLFKSSNLRYFYGQAGKMEQNKNLNSFKEFGKKAYYLAGRQTNDVLKENVYLDLSKDFENYMSGFEEISNNFLFRLPNNVFIKNALKYSSKYSHNPTEYNKKSVRMYRELVQRHILNEKKN